MASLWETFNVDHKGGLITNLSPLQQGVEMPGSAQALTNFEPSIHGGYRRIEGFEKYDAAFIPPYGEPLVQASAQTGTTLTVGNLLFAPSVGDTFTIAGVANTYTIAAGGVAYTEASSSAVLTLTASLDSSPADKAAVTFGVSAPLIQGLEFYEEYQYATRGGVLWKSNGSGWTNVSVPSHGTVLVDGGSQTGTSITLDGLTSVPAVGDTFKIDGIELVYTVTAEPTIASLGATVAITPALDSSPSDNASVTFLGANRSGGGTSRFAKFDFTGAVSFIGVDGTGNPFTYDNTTFKTLVGVPSDVTGSQFVVEFKNHLFFGKNSFLTFTAPFKYDDFTAANGGGLINFAHDITGMIVFREQLIVFSTNTIHRITGNSVGDFQVQPISRDIGCIKPDTIQELGGDIIFMGPDGLRMLSATDRIGDFGFAVASRTIQKEAVDFMSTNSSFSSVVIREKNQYRVFGYTETYSPSVSRGILGAQFADQDTGSLAWAELKGIKSYCAQSVFCPCLQEEVITFAHSDGYVYRMEQGPSFAGGVINATFTTPYLPVTDPQIRKTWYKLHTYVDPEGAIEGQTALNFDFNKNGVIQPTAIDVNGGGTASFWGSMVWGTDTWGGNLEASFTSQVIGSSFTVSIQYTFTSNTLPPFSIDTSILEYKQAGRQ